MLSGYVQRNRERAKLFTKKVDGKVIEQSKDILSIDHDKLQMVFNDNNVTDIAGVQKLMDEGIVKAPLFKKLLKNYILDFEGETKQEIKVTEEVEKEAETKEEEESPIKIKI